MKIREAVHADLSAIVKMYTNDTLGAPRESLHRMDLYERAFNIITNDRHQELIVVENEEHEIIATFQITFIQHLIHCGSCVAQIESVQVRQDHRGKGVGESMFKWAFQRAKEKGAQTVQLTSDKRRSDAKRFYERLGFVASHEGFKREL